ncbi:hypothetical protein HK103_004166 [Boothiomyces macroporosus]|uniref:Uncharacterized protein n=1 Tax=Boothiomyces macroporosus TaxID=261099 RepID=A0AAD5UGX8_9FUNG|nr:hypothetical protein HK103_004166 [Boothiomyces macroporosus]
MFGRSEEKKKLDQQALSVANLTDIEETVPGEHTTCFNFEIYTKLGWIAWKEREASLYVIFERAFGATRCELKISDSLDVFAMEIEIPNDQIEKFTKLFKGKTLTAEIDKIHGIEPSICSWTDCRFGNLRKTHGSTLAHTNGNIRLTKEKSSAENIRKRLEGLENVSISRQKEVDAMKEMYINITKDISKKFDDLCHKIDMKVYNSCGSKFDSMESKIMKLLHEELTLLAMPYGFKHPPDGVHKRETGLHAVIDALHYQGDVIPDCEVSLSVPQGLSKEDSINGTRGSLYSNSQYLSSHSIHPKVKSPEGENFVQPAKVTKRGKTFSESSKKASFDKSEQELTNSPGRDRRVTIHNPVTIDKSKMDREITSRDNGEETQGRAIKPTNISITGSKDNIELDRPSALKAKPSSPGSPSVGRRVTIEKKTSFKDTPIIIPKEAAPIDSSQESLSDSNQMIKGATKLHSPDLSRKLSDTKPPSKTEQAKESATDKLPELPKQHADNEDYTFSF